MTAFTDNTDTVTICTKDWLTMLIILPIGVCQVIVLLITEVDSVYQYRHAVILLIATENSAYKSSSDNRSEDTVCYNPGTQIN